MAEPPYGIIRDLLNSGEIIPFLGAGASLCGRSIEAKWNEKTTSYLPSGKDLADLLAEDARLPSNDPHDREDLAKVASYYLERSSRKRLLERLHGVFNRDCQVGEVHRFLADIPVPLLIVTTNYDDLIEQALKAKGKPYHLVVHPTESKELAGSVLWWKPDAADFEAYPPAKLPLPPAKSLPLPPAKSPLPGIETTIIYKMHGSINRRDKALDSFVITEEDYINFLSRMTGQKAIPARFMAYFRTRPFLFLGYGLADWNLRVVLRNLASPAAIGAPVLAGSQTSYAIQYRPSELEQTLWGARNVDIFDMKIDDFVAEMREKYAEG